MKRTRALLLVLTLSLLWVLAGCGSQSAASPSAANSTTPSSSAASTADPDSNLPSNVSEIKLNDEEFEFHGVHLRLPNSIVLGELREKQIISMSSTTPDKAIMNEIWFNADAFAGDDIQYTVEAVDEEYNPIQAMLIYGLYSSDDPDQEVKAISGTYAAVKKTPEAGTHKNCTDIHLILDSEIVTITFANENGNCDDIIQEAIDTIRVDEDRVPDFIKSLRPDALRDAGLRTEAWRIGGEHAVYLNMPEDYSPVIGDDGQVAWVSSDQSTLVLAEEITPSYYDSSEEDIEAALIGTPGFEKLEYFGKGPYHSMYTIDYQYEDPSNNRWIYETYVQPFKYSNNPGNVIPGILITVYGPDKEEVQLNDAIATLRYADGFSHNGIIDIEEAAARG